MKKFLIMESGYKKVNPKMRKMGLIVKCYWIYGQVENWAKLDIGDYVDKVV